MNIIEVTDLSKIYDKNKPEMKALDHVKLDIKKGEFVSIVGPSGSGKSTLLHLLGGLDRPSEGKVLIAGEDIYQLKENSLAKFRREKIGFIFQQYSLIPVLTLRENIEISLRLDHKKMKPEDLRNLIDKLGLTGKEQSLPNQLSGGEQQRVAIGRAIANNPAIILADEPTGNLDTKNTYEIIKLLKSLVLQEQQTLIMITHNEKVVEYADRIIYIEDGKLRQVAQN